METKKCLRCGEYKDLRGISGDYALCWDCSDKMLELKLISEDCDGLLYSYTDNRCRNHIIKEKEEKVAKQSWQEEINQINKAIDVLGANKFFNPLQPQYVYDLLVARRWELAKKIEENK